MNNLVVKSSDNNGYIIKFYRIMDRSKVDKILTFDYYCWGWFDGIKVINVKHILDYQTKSLDFNDLDVIDKECHRQKLLIYNNKNDNGVLNKDNYQEMPLLSVTIVNLSKKIQSKESLENYLTSIKDEYFKHSKFEYAVFGVLSANNFVIACRSNNYFDIKRFIFAIREYLYTSGVYTVFGVLNDLEILKKNWKESYNLKAHIQLSTQPSYSPKDINKYINSFTEPSLHLDCSLLVGKKDCAVSCDIDINDTDSIKKFVEFTFNKGFYSEYNGKSSPVVSTSTNFLYDNKLFENLDFNEISTQEIVSKVDDSIKCQHESAKTLYEKWNKSIETDMKGKLSNNFIYEFKRLALRTYQLLCGCEKNSITSLDVIEGIGKFFELTKTIAKTIDKNDINSNAASSHLSTIISGLLALNTLLDNREVNEFHEFESPRSNIIFTGNSFKLIEFYSIYARDVILLLKKWDKFTGSNDNSKSNYFFLTTDGYSEVTVTRLFLSSENSRLLNARVPTELLYTPYYTMCMLAHELGHFSKVGWDRTTRNRYFTLSVIFALILKESDLNLDRPQLAKVFFSYYDNLNSYDTNFKNFTDLIKKNIKVTLNTIVDSEFDKNNMVEQFISIIDGDIYVIQDAFREAPADMFMIKVLQIEEPIAYLKIAINYFVYMGYNCRVLSKNIVLRLSAVLFYMHITKMNIQIPDSFHAYKEIMSAIIDSILKTKTTVNEQEIEDTCFCLKENVLNEFFFYQFRPLVLFLKEIVALGIKESSTDILLDFKPYVDFINNRSEGNDEFQHFMKLMELTQDRHNPSSDDRTD